MWQPARSHIRPPSGHHEGGYMNRSAARTLVNVLCVVCFLTAGSGAAQETFRNPAMEPNDPFQQAFARARELALQGDIDGAIQQYHDAAKLREGKCAECFEMIAKIHFQLGRYKEASAAFKQSV